MNDYANASFVGNNNVLIGGYLPSNTSLLVDNLKVDESPLKIFGLAKKKINEIFDEIHKYLQECQEFLSLDTQVPRFTDAQRSSLEQYIEKTLKIKDVLERNQMKVAFFGRTSNGKSTVINSVLHRNILPYGMGHTTNCFLQIEGIDSNDPYYSLDADPDKRLNIEDINLLANALDSENLGDDTLCRIYWPKHKCNLLKDEVVLVDSPGIDVSPNLDLWIDKYCLDADVFVLVSNSESTMLHSEKSFFHKVSQKISKPNIFILNNRWDVVAVEPESAKVKKQHTERNVTFLSDELNVMTRKEAEERVFFVSAKEVINTRLQGKQALNGSLCEGHQQRYFEFENFERKFEECLSKSAIKTKFDQHTRCAREITKELIHIMDTSYNKALELREQKQLELSQKQQRLQNINQQIELFTREMRFLVTNIVDKVENKVSLAFNEEIKRLSLLIKDFNQPFSDEALSLSMYKTRLHSYIESGLDQNLKARLNNTLKICLDNARDVMVSRVYTIIPNEIELNRSEFAPQTEFTLFYQLNCKSLCSDFQEDLEFRFSFGLFNLLKFFNSGRWNVFDKMKSSKPRSFAQLPAGTSSSMDSLEVTRRDDSDLMHFIEKFSLIAPQSPTMMGTLAIGGFIVKTVDYRILLVVVGIYSLTYGYERLTWTNKKKEKVFKKQYARHATEKLRLIVDLTSANCSHQIKQELNSICAKMENICNQVNHKLESEIAGLTTQISELEECLVSSRKLKNHALYLSSELDTFWERYLNHDL